jgi:hypothetical protein
MQGCKVFTGKVFIYSLNFKKLHFSSCEHSLQPARGAGLPSKRPKSVHAVNTFQAAREHF